MGMRDYDPATGRFTIRDPLLLAGGDANVFAYAGGDLIQRSDPLGMFGLGTTLCDGVCVGFKWSITGDGISACVEGGAGEGNDVEIDPLGGLDDNKAYLKGSIEANLGNVGKLEISHELSYDGHCGKEKTTGKGCVVGGCVSTSDITIDPNHAREAFHQSEHVLEGKLLAGVCQQLRW
jgi:hypothetical protein